VHLANIWITKFQYFVTRLDRTTLDHTTLSKLSWVTKKKPKYREKKYFPLLHSFIPPLQLATYRPICLLRIKTAYQICIRIFIWKIGLWYCSDINWTAYRRQWQKTVWQCFMDWRLFIIIGEKEPIKLITSFRTLEIHCMSRCNSYLHVASCQGVGNHDQGRDHQPRKNRWTEWLQENNLENYR